MKRKKIIMISVGVAVVAAILFAVIFVAPVLRENESKNRLFPEMKARLGEVESSVVGLLPKTENRKDGSVTYGHGGSGVIIRRDSDKCYAVTAAHVVNDKNAVYKVYTAKTEVETVSEPAFDKLGMEVLDPGFYDKLANVRVEYVSQSADLAIVSFPADSELAVAQLDEGDPSPGDKLVCLGHPDGKRLTVSYGLITSDLKTVTMTDKQSGQESTDEVYEHDAYLHPGSSGGAAFSDDMLLCGINTGGAFDLFEHFSGGFMIPVSSVRACIAEWEKQ